MSTLTRFLDRFSTCQRTLFIVFQNEFNLDQISYDNRINGRKKSKKFSWSSCLVYWCWNGWRECIKSLYLSVLSFGTVFAFLFSRHVRINWHKIQTLMIFRGMFGFSFWHNFYMEVKNFVYFVLSHKIYYYFICWNFKC